jgi:hypothetical protein
MTLYKIINVSPIHRGFILVLDNRWIRNHNRWSVGGPGGKAPRKLLAFQHLNELLVHVFLPIFASIFTCITALLCVKETTTLTQQKITKKIKYSTERDLPWLITERVVPTQIYQIRLPLSKFIVFSAFFLKILKTSGKKQSPTLS